MYAVRISGKKPRKRKVKQVAAGVGSGGKEEVVKVKSDSGQEGNCEDDRAGVAFNEQDDDGRRRMDWQALLAIFPEEVWKLMFESIEDPDLLECLCNASPAFRQLLLPRRVQFLFPKVWDNVLGIKYHKEAVAYSGDKAYKEPSLCSYSLPWKTTKSGHPEAKTRTSRYTGIIKLRMVCKTWCDAIDHWYQNQQFRFKMHNDIDIAPADTIIKGVNTLTMNTFRSSSTTAVESFSTHFDSTHCVDGVAVRNPFLGRAVHVFIDDRGGDQAARLAPMRALFLKYGRYIWYLTVHVADSFFRTSIMCYSAIRTLLQVAPNLRIFHLEYESDGNHFDFCSELYSYINSHPLPRLHNLQFLTTRRTRETYSRKMPPILLRELVRVSRARLSMLEIGPHFELRDDCHISTATVPHLRELSVRLSSYNNVEDFFDGQINWQLSKLDLDLGGATDLKWDWLFQQLQDNWGDSLTTLILCLPLIESVEYQNIMLEQGGDLRVHLRRLSSLKLTMSNFCCLDFLLPMKDTLEVLDLRVNASVEREEQVGLVKVLERGKMIQLLSSPDKPMDSNIWTLFPRLKLMELNYSLESRWKKSTKWYMSRSSKRLGS